MPRTKLLIPIVSGTALAWAVAAWAQTPVDGRTYNVDGRVTPAITNPGQARDYNTRIGGNGLNAPSTSGSYINSTNAIISGDVYGLGGFHSTPSAGGYRNSFNTTGLAGLNSGVISNPYLFQTNLPSANLSYFNRRGYSVGDSQYIGTAPRDPATVPYYARSNTVANVGAIKQGLNQPGSSTLQTPFTPLYQGTNATYAPPPNSVNQQLTPPDRRIMVPDTLQPLNTPGTPLAYDSVGTTSVPNWQRDYMSAVQSPLFGPTGLDARLTPSTLANSIRGRNAPGNAQPDQGQPNADQMASVDARGVLPTDIAPRTETIAPEQVGSDRFADMLGAVHEAQKAEPDFITKINTSRVTGKAGGPLMDRPQQPQNTPMNPALSPISPIQPKPGQPGTVGPGAAGGPAPTEGPQALPRDSREARQMDRAQRMKDWAREMISRPVTTFAGKGQDELNQYLMSAETYLRSGEYYNAAGQFGLASQVAPGNPLPLIGRGNALAAAGDYISAVLFLQRGIARFPDIVAFDLDLPALVGGKDVFDLRRADLEKQLARVDSYELRFLLGYLEYYSGLRDVGLKELQRAAAKAPAGSIIAKFPDMLTGKIQPDASGKPAGGSVN